MKLLVLGDIHGRTCWKDILDRETWDKVIFLGDYVSTHDNVTEAEQILNFQEILDLKRDNPERVILLRGNHLNQHLGYNWAKCSGYFRNVGQFCEEFKYEILSNTQWIYIQDNIIFSHAGVSQVWLDNQKLDLLTLNEQKPSEKFGFIPDSPFDYYGNSTTQSCEWIRPTSLCECNVKGYTQVIGHTPVSHITDIYKSTKYNEHIWLCDCLSHEYLIIDDGKFMPTKYEDLIELPNRDGNKLYLREIGDDWYKLDGDLGPISVSQSPDGTITMIDPSGGPMLSVGSTLEDKTITKIIKSDKGFQLKLF